MFKVRGITISVPVIISVILLLTLAACSGGNKEKSAGQSQSTPQASENQAPPKQQEKKVTIRFQVNMPPENYTTVAAEKFKKQVEDQSGGRIIVQSYPAGVLYSDKDTTQAVLDGSLEMGVNSMSWWGALDKSLMILDVPFMWPNYESVWKAGQGELGQKIGSIIDKTGAKFLTFMPYGPIDTFVTVSKQIKSPTDFKGMKIRSFGELFAKLLEGLGAAPAVIAATEVYTALQRGVVDGAVSGSTTVEAFRWAEAGKYVTKVPLDMYLMPITVNPKWWDSLSKPDQQLIMQALQGSTKYAKDLQLSEEDRAMAGIKKQGPQVYYVPETELGQWKEFGKPVTDYYLQVAGPTGKELIDTATRLSKQ